MTKGSKVYSFDSDAQVNKDWDDSRYIKMRLRIVNEGTNPNDTNFGANAISNAKDSLANTPILANIIVDAEAGEIDAGSHDYEIVKDPVNGGYRKLYKEQVIGIIPETHNYKIEEYDGKQYVHADAYIFRGYANYGEDFVEQNDEINISMEIEASEIAEFESGMIDILGYKYLGVTILGNTLTTGIEDAKGFKFSSQLERDKDFIERCNELKYMLEGEGEETMDKDKTTIETEVVEEFEEVETPAQDEVTIEDNGTEIVEQEFESTEEVEVETEEFFELTYKLSHDDIRTQLYGSMDDEDWPWIVSVFDDYFIYESDGDFYKRTYSREGDEVSIGESKEKVTTQYLTHDETVALDTLRATQFELEKEVETLREFKSNVEAVEAEAKVAEFREEKIEFMKKDFGFLNEEQIGVFTQNIDEYESIEDLETALCVYVVKNKVKKFSKKEEEKPAVKPVADFEEEKNNVGFYGKYSPRTN